MIRIMTFNIRGALGEDGGNMWDKRKSLTLKVIKDYKPDIIGFQEMQKGNRDYFDIHLKEYQKKGGIKYNNAEPWIAYNSIFWHKDKFNAINDGDFWVSETPDKYSSSWASDCIRSVSWVHLKIKNSRLEIIHFNTHLDHISNRAREEGAKLIIDYYKKINSDHLPLILTGDFNCNPKSKPYKIFIKSGLVDSAYILKDNGKKCYTYHGFSGKRKLKGAGRIDWILLSNKFIIKSYNIIKDNNDPIYPSDHYPVITDVELNTNS